MSDTGVAEIPVDEDERPLVPVEEGVEDLQGLVLDAPPEVFGGDGAHLHEELAVAGLGGDAALGLLVLREGDLAVAEEELAEGVLGGVGVGEHDLAFFPVDGALEVLVAHDELAAAAAAAASRKAYAAAWSLADTKLTSSRF